MKQHSIGLLAVFACLCVISHQIMAVNAQAAPVIFNMDCALVVPPDPLLATGLATPYQLKSLVPTAGMVDCAMVNPMQQGTFVEAVIFEPSTGELKVYHPLVVTAGLTPAQPVIPPVVSPTAVVGIWFGTNANTLTLMNSATQGSLIMGNCINGGGNPGPIINGDVFGQFASCNAENFFNAVNTYIKAGKTLTPSLQTKLATAVDGRPCPTTRDFSLVDMDPSDNVVTTYLVDMATGQSAQDTVANRNAMMQAIIAANGSDNRLMTVSSLNQVLGCASNNYAAASAMEPGRRLPALALNELQAAALAATSGPIAYIPRGDPMVLYKTAPLTGMVNMNKLNNYRVAVNQPRVTDMNQADNLHFCAHYIDYHLPRLSDNLNGMSAAVSPDPNAANSLYTFLAQRFAASFVGLKCDVLLDMLPPITVTKDGNGVVTQATVKLVPNIWTQLIETTDPYMVPPGGLAPTPAPTPVPAPTPAPTPAPPGTACPNGCSNNGVCVVIQSTGQSVCHCNSAEFLGPDCSFTMGQQIQLSAMHGLSLTTSLDHANKVMHFRMETPMEQNWIGVGIDATSDGMTNGDLWVAYPENGQWKLVDMWGTGTQRPTVDTQQDLMHSAVWMSASGGVVATWSRLLTTTDTQQDVALTTNATHTISWAVGKSSVFAVHENEEGLGSGQINMYNFTDVPSKLAPVPPVAPPPMPVPPQQGACGPDAPQGCANGGVCMNSKCHCPAIALGPDCMSTMGIRYQLSANLHLTTSRMMGNVMHFRLERTDAVGWMGFGIGKPSTNAAQYDGMTNTDLAVVTQENGAWTIKDMWGTGQSMPTLDVQQDLMFPAVWTTGGGIVATWSRMLTTGDAMDNPIPGTSVFISCAQGSTNNYKDGHGGDDGGVKSQANLLETQIDLTAPVVTPTQAINNVAGGQSIVTIVLSIVGAVVLLGAYWYYQKNQQSSVATGMSDRTPAARAYQRLHN